jgi:hypothetical protein
MPFVRVLGVLSADSLKSGIVSGRWPEGFPLPVRGRAGSDRSAASEGGSVRGSPCDEPARLRLTSLRPRSFGLLRR